MYAWNRPPYPEGLSASSRAHLLPASRCSQAKMVARRDSFSWCEAAPWRREKAHEKGRFNAGPETRSGARREASPLAIVIDERAVRGAREGGADFANEDAVI